MGKEWGEKMKYYYLRRLGRGSKIEVRVFNEAVKRMITVSLFILGIIGSVLIADPVQAEAEIKTYGDFGYEIRNDKASIVKYNGKDSIVTVPGSIDGCTVNYISAKAFINCKTIKKISLPDSIKEIGDYAFAGCSSLTELKLSDSLESLGCAVIENTAVANIKIPKNVKKVHVLADKGALANCKTLTEVEFEQGMETIPGYILSNNNDISKVKTVIIPKSVKRIGARAFYKCRSLELSRLPTVKGIGDSAFAGCSNITAFTFPKSLERLGSCAFEGCINLVSIDFNPDEIVNLEIGDKAFWGCKALSTVNFAGNVSKIGNYAFSGCKSLKTLKLPADIKELGRQFIENTSVKSIIIPKSLSKSQYSAQNGALANCGTLTKVTFEKGMEKIPAYILASKYYESKVTTVVTPDTVKEIGYEAFYNCKKLKLKTLAEVETIGSRAFEGCISIKSFQFPKTLESLGAYAFNGCEELKEVCFAENKSKSISLYIHNGAFCNCLSLKKVDLSENTKSLKNSVFANCGVLKTLTLPDSIEEIGANIIEKTAVESIVIPPNVKKCSKMAVNCTSLKKAEFASGMEKIPADVFADKYYRCSVESITIPKTVTEISSRAFTGCSSFVIYGYKDSYAEIFAEENSYTFYTINDKSSKKSKTEKELDTEISNKANIAAKKLKKLSKNEGIVSWNKSLDDIFTKKQLALIGDAILCMAVLSEVPESSFNDQIAEKVMDKYLGSWKTNLWSGSRVVPVRVTVNSGKYGKVTVEFSCKVDSYALNKTIIGQWGNLNYKIVENTGSKKIEKGKLSGTAGMMACPSVKDFSEAAYSLAGSEIEKAVKSAYNSAWGSNADKVAEYLFGRTISDILKKTDSGSFSNLIFDFMVMAAKS